MKKMKRFVALALSVVMVLAMSVMAFAESTTYTITITNATKEHTYEAYQIFSGKLSDGKLTDIKWGNGVNSFEYNEKSKAEDIAKSLTEDNVKDFAKTAGTKLTNVTSGTYAYNENEKVGKISGLSAGYYLVKDADNSVSGADSYTSYILKVAGNVEVSPKTGVPTVEKKVKENVKETNEEGKDTDTRIPEYEIPAKYNDVADYNIGDNVPFQLIGTMPSNIDSYDHYYYEFSDTLSAGLTYNNDAVVKIDGTEVTAEITSDGTSLKIVLMDVKALATVNSNSIITVDYTAKLNTAAKVGLPGNPNEVKLIFSNNPNKTGDGTKKPDNTGETPKDVVIVFTYELDTEKVDGTDNTKKLSGAKFILLNSDKSKGAKVEDGKFAGWEDINNATELTTGTDGLIKVAGLDDGTYYLRETEAPAGYNKLTDDVTVIITATTANGQTWTNEDPKDALTNLGVQSKNGENGDSLSGTVDDNKGIAKVQIANNEGSSLPSTGGIGTTIFYIVGGILMVGAAVLLITKRRAEN